MAGKITVTTSSTTMEPSVSDQLGHHRRVTGTLTMSAAYVAGGDTFTAAQFGLGLVTDLWIQPSTIARGTTGWVFSPTLNADLQGGFVQLLGTGASDNAALGEAANGDYSTVTARFNAWGV